MGLSSGHAYPSPKLSGSRGFIEGQPPYPRIKSKPQAQKSKTLPVKALAGLLLILEFEIKSWADIFRQLEFRS